MHVEKLDHYSVRTADLDRAIKFYADALDFWAGPRPPSPTPGAWLYARSAAGEAAGHPVVHLIGVNASAGRTLSEHVQDHHLPTARTGAVDHIAFAASGAADMRARLTRHGIAFRERTAPNMPLHQMFMEDPDGVMIELNYSRPEDVESATAL